MISHRYIQYHILLKKARALCVLLSVTLCLFSCTASRVSEFSPRNKIAPDKLKEDAQLLQKILEANHPSLYWYTPKDSVDYYFNTTINSITDSLTELQFRNKMSWMVAKIHCGHTAVRSSKEYAHFFTTHKTPQFPLGIKVWQDSLVVVNNSIRTDTVFKRGTVITSINGRPARAIIDSMFQFISTDGYANNFKYQLVSFYFPLFYNITFGLRDSNIITYVDGSGIEQTGGIKNFRPAPDTSKNRSVNNIPFPKPTRKQIRAARRSNGNNLTFDSTNTAYLRLITFSGSGLRGLFKRSFEAIKEKHATNLVIDLRENSGGNIGAEANLTSYLIQHPFTVADSVSAKSRRFKYHQYIHPSFVYKAIMLFSAKKKDDGRYHFGYLEHHLFKPKKDLHFDGNVYIMQGGFTFSAASMFVSHLKGQSNVTVVGEETGGGNYGNSSVHLPTVILPNSHIQVILPMYRIVNRIARAKDGRGIMPDIYIGPSTDAIRRGVDSKMEKVKELIEAKKKL
jgi:C-terminal processing protease CtpA/Prc